MALSTGTGFKISTSWGAWADESFSLSFADVNGDGKADSVGRNGSSVYVGLSTGATFSYASVWGSLSSGYSLSFADVNGDGKADMIGRDSSTGDVQVGLSTGSAFAPPSLWSTWSPAYSAYFADVNGDGRADLIGRNGTGDLQVSLSVK